MNILLTGGLGFIGSHVACILGNYKEYKIIIVDNLDNSKRETFNNILSIVKYSDNLTFIEGDILHKDVLESIFTKYEIDSVIHFASLKAVGESIENPLLYYNKNINGLLNILEVMKNNGTKRLIFSSSATVYGNENELPIKETDKVGINISNPYGKTKYFQEEILKDFIKVNEDFEIIILRYFNPVGTHSSGKIGEDPNDTPNNLFPYILRVSIGEYERLNIYGDNYDTIDGSGVRDYIHVMDLSEGHVKALEKIKKGLNIYNLGTGKGISVLEMVKTFEEVNKCKIPYKIMERRNGDIGEIFADVSKANDELGWKANKTLKDICKDGYNFIKLI
jgi:UDP-glucose 4-epimerase